MWSAVELFVQPVLILLGVSVFALLVLGAAQGLWRKSGLMRAVAVLGHAALVLVVMVAWVNGQPGFFDENTRLMQLVAGTKELRHGAPDPRDQGVDLILVDQTKSKVVVSPSGNAQAESGIPITDRQQLATLMQLLAQHRERIGLVVCDILFDRSTPNDSALAAAMVPLVEDEKLVLAHGDMDNTPLLHFPQAMGSVTTGTQGGRVVRQELVNDAGVPTLPYLMHARYHRLGLRPSRLGFFQMEEHADRTVRAYPYLIPFMDRLSEASYRLPERSVGSGSVAAPPLLPLELRHVVKAGEALLVPRLLESTAPKGPIIFIGEFLGAPELGSTDLHPTYRGEQQGATILLNQFLELEGGAHHFNGEPLLIQFVLLAVASAIIFTHFSKRKHWPKWAKWYYDPAEDKSGGSIFHAGWRAAREYVLDGLPAIVIAAFFGLFAWLYRQPANFGALILYLVLLDRLARLAKPRPS